MRLRSPFDPYEAFLPQCVKFGTKFAETGSNCLKKLGRALITKASHSKYIQTIFGGIW